MASCSKTLKTRLLSAAFLLALGPLGGSLTGCSLLVDFDRSKIHEGAADDASTDATTTDATTPDANTSDAEPETGADATTDGATSDAQPAADAEAGTALDASDAGDASADAGDASTDAADASRDATTDAADASRDASRDATADASDAGDAGDGGAPDCGVNDCDDGNACTTDVCVSDGVCANSPVTNGLACDDGNACTVGDSCQVGVCAAGIAKTCPSPTGTCKVAGTCNTLSGACGAETDAPNGATCSDGNACTQNDVCASGACVPGAAVTCPAPSGTCKVAGTCDSTTGSCGAETNKADGALCNDANACTVGDSCAAGLCRPGLPTVCTPAGTCQITGVCDTTSGACGAPTNAPATTPCDDGVACTAADHCSGAGACAAGLPTDALCTDPAAPICSATGCVARAAASLVVTELNALGGGVGNEEFVELYLPTTATRGNIAGFTITNAAGTAFTLHPRTDPTGSGGATLYMEPGDYAYGIANPASAASIPADAKFVIGEPGTAFALNEAGDEIVVRDGVGTVLDTVDFRAAPTGPGFVYDTSGSASITGAAFPGFAGKSTQLDSGLLTTLANDSGAAWCTSYVSANTRGQPNGSCGARAVVNEVLFDPDGADEGRAFLEIAGPGGADIGGYVLQSYTSPSHTVVVDVTLPAGTRIPLDGFFVLADGATNGGTTQVPNADLVVADGTFAAAPGVVSISARGLSTLDTVQYGGDAATSLGEGAPVPVVTTPGLSISIARDPLSTDTGDNATDFHSDPTPTPGDANGVVFAVVTSIDRNDGLAASATSVRFATRDVASPSATFAGVNGSCTVASTVADGRGGAVYACIAPANGGTVTRGTVALLNTAALGGATVSAPGTWTYTGVDNGSADPRQIDYCTLQFPATATTASGAATVTIYGRAYEPSLTPGGALRADVGFGPDGSDPTTSADWRFTAAVYNPSPGPPNEPNNSEYAATITPPTVSSAATYGYTYRFSQDDGLHYTYCDLDGAGANSGLSFDMAASGGGANLGVLTVNP